MSVIAWTYDNYYCWGIRQNYRGVFESEEDVKKYVLGDRHEKQNLEILDLDTLGFKKYEWRPYYDIRLEDIDPKDPDYRKDKEPYENKREFLKYKWNNEKEFQVDWYGGYGNRREGYHQALVDAGEWILV